MKLTRRSPSETRAYFQGWNAALDAVGARLAQVGRIVLGPSAFSEMENLRQPIPELEQQMTRDEAVQLLIKTMGWHACAEYAACFIDSFEALGMLKLDEPKNVYLDATEQLAHHTKMAYSDAARLVNTLHDLGFEIVGKQK